MRNPPNGTAPKSLRTNKKKHDILAGWNTFGDHRLGSIRKILFVVSRYYQRTYVTPGSPPAPKSLHSNNLSRIVPLVQHLEQHPAHRHGERTREPIHKIFITKNHFWFSSYCFCISSRSRTIVICSSRISLDWALMVAIVSINVDSLLYVHSEHRFFIISLVGISIFNYLY